MKYNPEEYVFADEGDGSNNQQSQYNQNEPEGWGQYLGRNAAQFPLANVRPALLSGLGTGNALELLARKLGAPESVMNALKENLPTFQQARENTRERYPMVPEYYTQEKPEDEYLRMAAMLPLTGVKSLLGAGKAGATIAGSKAGQYLGGLAGKALGDEEVGSFLGGYAGGAAANKGINLAQNVPSRTFPQKVAAAEESAFNKNKATKKAELTKELKPKIQELSKDNIKATLALPKEKSAFDATKKDLEYKVRKEKTDFDKNIKSLEVERTPIYNEALDLGKGHFGDTKPLLEFTKNIRKGLDLGINSKDQSKIKKILSQLDKKAKAKKGFSINDAKEMKQNINDQRFDKDTSYAVKKNIGKVANELNEYIKNGAGEEHFEVYSKADKMHQDLVKLKKEQPDFIKAADQRIKDIKSEKFSPIKEVALKSDAARAKKDLSLANKDYKEALNNIDKSEYKDWVKSEIASGKSASTLDEILNKPTSTTDNIVYGSLAYALGTMAGNKPLAGALSVAGMFAKRAGKEYKIAKQVAKTHPKIYNEWADIVMDSSSKSQAKLLSQISLANKKTKEAAKQDTGKVYNPNDYDFAD